MNTLEFLSELRRLEIKVSADGDRLRLSAPKGVLTPTLREQLAERKAEILAFLNNASRPTDSTLVPLQPVARNENLPLSSAQQRLWFLDQLEPNSSAYNIPVAYRLTGQLNVVVLEKSIGEILQRHETLRTTFSSVNGQPIQVITEQINFSLPLVDLRNLPETEREAEAQRLVIQEQEQPFNLATGPLWRTQLLQLDQQESLLLVTMHHSVSDGWSVGVFEQELTALYEAFCTGKASPLPELPIQYADFAHWQQQWLQSEDFKYQLDYWKQQLGGALPVLELPTDRPRPPVQTDRGAEQTLILPQKLSEALKDLSRQEGATLAMTMLAGFKTLLYRYTGQEDIIVGSPVAGRNRAELERLIGFFISTVVMRSDLSGNPSFRQLLSRVRQVALDAYAHQDVPFDKLVEELQPERDLSRTPIFQVWFNMLNLGDQELTLSELKVEPFSSQGTRSKFDLTLYVQEQPAQGIRLKLVYNVALFEPERMEEMLAQFQHLLEQIVEQPEAGIASFSLVTPKAQLILPNPTQELCSKWEKAPHQRFSQQAQQVPEKLAVVDAQETWSYDELEAWSNQLAHYLLKHGIGSQDVVAIYGHRSAALVWAMLGVIKAGAAFMILDPAYPAARLIDCLGIAQPKGWLQIEAAGELPRALAEFLETLSCCCHLKLPQRSIAAQRGLLTDYATDDPGVAIDPDQLLYVAFTSGSTGIPKGILGTHRPVSHFLEWHGRAFGFNQQDRFCMLSGLSHDPLLRNIFTPLWLGATLYIPQQQDIETPGQLAAWIRQHQVSIAHLTPAMGQLLTETQSHTTSPITSLRYLFFGGEILTQQDVAQICQLAPKATCVNFYGATETPQAMGYYTIPHPTERAYDGQLSPLKGTIPLGRGIEDVQLLILNSTHQLAGIGEVGQIYIRTPYLAKGYIGNQELTQERFLVNPFTNLATDRLYQTGDLGRYLPDGNIEFLGRADHQVKIRGFRIELGEIEAVLVQHPVVRESVVMAREDQPGDKRLVAYIVSHPEQVAASSELRGFLQQKLPNYMIPSAFVMLETIPLTPNGKIDYRALPAPNEVKQELEGAFTAPKDEIELLLTKIWEKVLDRKSIGVKDNFFELGGHSLLALRLLSEIEKTFAKNLPLVTFFEAQTVEQLANILRQEEGTAQWRSLVMVQPGSSSKPPLFCVHAIWGNVLFYQKLVRHLEPDQPFYGLQAQGLDGKHTPSTSVEEMAAHYIKEIQTVQPEGPYFLGGFSFGGLVVFEIARQLRAQGQKVALLAIFDTVAPAYYEPTSGSGYTEHTTFWGKGFFHLRNLLKLGLNDQLSYVWFRLKWHLTAGKLSIFYKSYLRYIKRSPQDLRLLDVAWANYQARQNYVPEVYADQLTLFRASDRDAGSDYQPTLGWGELVEGEVEIHEVPGSHTDVMEEPTVRLLAEKLMARLNRVQAGDLERPTDAIAPVIDERNKISV
jgi:amino acid adenylation domain-containing protein